MSLSEISERELGVLRWIASQMAPAIPAGDGPRRSIAPTSPPLKKWAEDFAQLESLLTEFGPGVDDVLRSLDEDAFLQVRELWRHEKSRDSRDDPGVVSEWLSPSEDVPADRTWTALLNSDRRVRWINELNSWLIREIHVRATEKGRGVLARLAVRKSPTHSPDFTSVDWFGTRHKFSKGNQAESVRVLWEAWDAGRHSLAQESIGTAIESAANRFELKQVFRRKKPGVGHETHSAWGTMIQQDSKGCYLLVPPESA